MWLKKYTPIDLKLCALLSLDYFLVHGPLSHRSVKIFKIFGHIYTICFPRNYNTSCGKPPVPVMVAEIGPCSRSLQEI